MRSILLTLCILICQIVYAMNHQSSDKKDPIKTDITKQPEKHKKLNQSWKQVHTEHGLCVIESKTELTTARAYDLVTKVKEEKSK